MSFSVCHWVHVASPLVRVSYWLPIRRCVVSLQFSRVLFSCVLLLLLYSDGLLDLCLMHGTKHFKLPLTTPVLEFPTLFQNFSLLKNPISAFFFPFAFSNVQYENDYSVNVSWMKTCTRNASMLETAYRKKWCSVIWDISRSVLWYVLILREIMQYFCHHHNSLHDCFISQII